MRLRAAARGRKRLLLVRQLQIVKSLDHRRHLRRGVAAGHRGRQGPAELQLDGVDLPADQQPTFTQVGQILTWEWNNPSPALTINPLPLGSHHLTVDFFARVPRGQAPNTYINTMYTVTDSVDAVCENGTQVQDSGNGDVDGCCYGYYDDVKE